MFRGMGKIGIRTLSSPRIMYAPRANSFKLGLENTEQEAKAFPQGSCGPLQTVDKVISDQTWKLNLGMESFDPEDIGFVMGERLATSTMTIPEVLSIIVPVNGVVTNADLTVDRLASATLLDSLQGVRFLTQIPNAATFATTTQFKVGAGSISFHPSMAGQALNYMYDKSLVGTRTIGFEQNVVLWGDVCFSGVVCGTRFSKPFRIFVPSMARSGNLDFSIGEKTSIDLEFTLKLLAGYRSPVLMADL